MRRGFSRSKASSPTETPADRPEAEVRREARELALRRLSIREHSSRELETYLKQRQIPAEIAAETVAQLTEEKLQDDRRFARAMTRSQVVREKGPGFILQKLRQKGVRIELSEVKELFGDTSDHNELEMARKLVARRYPRASQDERELRRAYAALLRRGFSGDVARKALLGRVPEGASDEEG
jgi:regulatory protein